MQRWYKMNEFDKIIESIKISTKQIQKLIAKGDMGKSDQQNSTGDTQLKLDILSDQIIEQNFKKIDAIKQIVSEEQDNIVPICENGKYLVAYDPLDGSSLVDVNLSVGSIYGIYEDDFKGSNIKAAVYVVFGPRVEMVIAKDNQVKLYRLVQDEFEYIKDIKMKQQGYINSPGSTRQCWYQSHIKLIESMFEDGYKLNYSGGMVPDLHHILLRGGGLFSYPGASDKPKGKLRQLFEVFPFALVFEMAQGGATNGTKRVLDIETTHIHDTTPCYFGSINELERVKQSFNA